MDIVSYGSDIDILKRKIDSLSEKSKEIISLHGKTDFEELDEYFNKAKLYIGMGTTILDASQRGIISIPVVSYTEELIADKFFHENDETLTLEASDSNNILKLYDAIKRLNYREYLELSQMTRMLAIEKHSVEKVTEKFVNNFVNMKYNKFSFIIFLLRQMDIIQHSFKLR